MSVWHDDGVAITDNDVLCDVTVTTPQPTKLLKDCHHCNVI